MEKRKVIGLCISFLIIGIIIGSITIVIAESINSDEVLYDNSNSATSNDNVQDVLDDMYRLIGHSSLGYSLLAHAPQGLSTELVAGLYRYQGVQDANNTVDNYICFGTTNKNTCVSDLDKYMYRIIGINEVGEMKLIKKEALNTAYAWDSNDVGLDWVHSELYVSLNGNSFLTNTTYIPDSSWSNRMVTSTWHYLTTTDTTISTIAERELGSSETVNAKIGIMYLHDYAYSLTTPDYSNTSWINLRKNDSNPPNSDYEWTITKKSASGVWIMPSNYGIYSFSVINPFSVRPVFYLKASETIASGSGTLADPYILS